MLRPGGFLIPFAALALLDCRAKPDVRASASPEAQIEAPFAGDQKQLALHGGDIAWKACPKGFPADCGLAVLEGDPKRAELYTLRLRVGAPFTLPPHLHPRNERVTVLSGAIHVAFGTRIDKTMGQVFAAGDYYVNRATIPHYVWTTEPVTLQITGIGPWVVEPVRPTE